METFFFFSADVIDKNSLHLHTALFLLVWRGDPAEAEEASLKRSLRTPKNSEKNELKR